MREDLYRHKDDVTAKHRPLANGVSEMAAAGRISEIVGPYCAGVGSNDSRKGLGYGRR